MTNPDPTTRHNTATPNPKETTMTTTTPAADRFATDTEVTLTITGKVISGGSLGGRLVIEYLAENGFPDRIAVDINSTAVTAQAAPAPSPAEQKRRDDIHALIRDSHHA